MLSNELIMIISFIYYIMICYMKLVNSRYRNKNKTGKFRSRKIKPIRRGNSKLYKKTRNQRRSKHYRLKKIYKGGTFEDDYNDNIRKILTAIEMTSGRHQIDEESATNFINNQISPVRRQAARDLIENTEYITLEEISRTIEQLIIRIYEENDFNRTTEPIYFVSESPNKSNYFLTVLGLFYIRQKNYREPIIIDELNDEVLDTIGSNPIVILDDVSYSGSQLGDRMDNIYYNRVVKKELAVPKIFILLAGLNNFSLRRLSRVPSKILRSNMYCDYIESPFTLIYMPDKLYEPLLLKIGIERYSYVNLFFSPYTKGRNPFVSIYLDHKVADAVSTYLKALVYGPIVPANYNYQEFFGENFNDKMEFIGFPSDLTKDEKNILLSKFDEENGTTIRMDKNITYNLANHMLEKLKTLDIIDDEYRGLNHLTFSPFITSCKDDPLLISNINDPEIINFNYSLFIVSSKDELPVPGKRPDGNQYYTLEIEKEEGLTREKTLEINKKIESFRCPVSWYKEGELMMVQQ